MADWKEIFSKINKMYPDACLFSHVETLLEGYERKDDGRDSLAFFTDAKKFFSQVYSSQPSISVNQANALFIKYQQSSDDADKFLSEWIDFKLEVYLWVCCTSAAQCNDMFLLYKETNESADDFLTDWQSFMGWDYHDLYDVTDDIDHEEAHLLFMTYKKSKLTLRNFRCELRKFEAEVFRHSRPWHFEDKITRQMFLKCKTLEEAHKKSNLTVPNFLRETTGLEKDLFCHTKEWFFKRIPDFLCETTYFQKELLCQSKEMVIKREFKQRFCKSVPDFLH